ncbi:hypothetical protein PM082_018598 [Marasmius tenuissimus]|nr:hypothetical protein PM082_018598 [Marasmius tenuissimus]
MAGGLKMHDTLGAALIGFVVSAFVFGIFCSSTLTYFKRFYRDGWEYKILVSGVWILELLHQICVGHFVYTYYGNPLIILTGDVAKSLIYQVLLTALVATIVKCSFAVRVWRFSKHNIPMTLIIVLLSLAQLALGGVYAAKCFQLKKLLYLSNVKLIATLSLASGAVADLVTALTLCYYLQKFRTGFRQTDTVINTLMMYTINTGGLTSIMSILTVVLYNIAPLSFQFMGMYFVLSKLYAVSLLCSLNMRTVVSGHGTEEEDSANPASGGRGNRPQAPVAYVLNSTNSTRSNLVFEGHAPTSSEQKDLPSRRSLTNHLNETVLEMKPSVPPLMASV